jgi:hypothetical protein
MAAIALTKCISAFQNIKVFEGTLDLASVAAAGAAMAEVDLTVAGVLATDMAVSFNCSDTGFTLGIGNLRVKAADTISIVFANTDDAASDPAGTLNYRLIVIGA